VSSANERGGRLVVSMPFRRNRSVTTMLEFSVANTAVALIASGRVLDERTEIVLVQALVESVRYTTDGSAPTTTHGHILFAGGFLPLYIEDAKSFRCIRADAAASDSAAIVASEHNF
jgi:hypothetical protein